MIDNTGMTDYEKTRIYMYNNLRRARLLSRAQNFETDFEKASFIVNYFTNNLPKDVVADIDDVSIKEVVDFNYDYSFLSGVDTLCDRKQEFVRYPMGRGVSISCVDRDVEVDGKPKIYPTIFALKLGTCTMFANEIKRLMANLGIDCDIVETPQTVDCYDYFNGEDVNGHKININEIKKIRHAYNIITIDGKKLKVDVAGYLTAKDYNQKHPMGQTEPIDTGRFCMTEDIESNPFADAKEKGM